MAVEFYRYSYRTAEQDGAVEEYRASRDENRRCTEFIQHPQTGLYANAYKDNVVDKDGTYLDKCIGEFGMQRMMFVIANTVKMSKHDGRWSPEVKEWAKDFMTSHTSEYADGCLSQIHTGVVNILAEKIIKKYNNLNLFSRKHCMDESVDMEGKVTKIRYGTAAGSCNMTSAPHYTKVGYYPVYYEIDYKYGTENMTENGVSYVWLLADDSKNNNSDNQKPVHEHDYRYIETVKPTCTELGYERWQCNTCGSLEKKNYVQTFGHTYKTQTIREATCRQGGLVLEICTKCGDFNEKTTPTAGHHYHDTVVNATCINAGYILHSCDICGESYMNINSFGGTDRKKVSRLRILMTL